MQKVLLYIVEKGKVTVLHYPNEQIKLRKSSEEFWFHDIFYTSTGVLLINLVTEKDKTLHQITN